MSALQGEPPRQGRELSHGALRRFQLVPLSGGPPVVLSLLPVRSRTGTELSEPSKELKGLNLLAVGAKPDQIALGRGPKDPAGAITRLQTCLTPSGHAGVSASTLVGQSEGQEQSASAALRRLLRLAGISPARHECLAVQVASGTPGERVLLAAWQDVQRLLRVP